MVELTTISIAVSASTFGAVFLIHTGFFLYKWFLHRRQQQTYTSDPLLAGGSLKTLEDTHFNYEDDSIELSSGEVTCCMGWVWNCMVENGRMKRSNFLIWYLVVVLLDAGLAVAMMFALAYVYNRRY